MPAGRPAEICFCCPETLYQALVRALAESTTRSRASVERDFAHHVELLLERLVARPPWLAELVKPPLKRVPAKSKRPLSSSGPASTPAGAKRRRAPARPRK